MERGAPDTDGRGRTDKGKTEGWERTAREGREGRGREGQSRCVAKCSKSSSQAEQSDGGDRGRVGVRSVGDRDKGEEREGGERREKGTVQKDSGMKPSTPNTAEFTHAPKGPSRGPNVKGTSNTLSRK